MATLLNLLKDWVLVEIRRAIRERGNDRILHLDSQALLQVIADDKKLRRSLLTDERLYRALLLERECRRVLEPTALSEGAPHPAGPTHPLLERLRNLLQARFPEFYSRIVEPTLADLRQEHSAAIAEGRPFKARCTLLQGCGALAAATVCQLGSSLLGCIAALWQARSSK